MNSTCLFKGQSVEFSKSLATFLVLGISVGLLACSPGNKGSDLKQRTFDHQTGEFRAGLEQELKAISYRNANATLVREGETRRLVLAGTSEGGVGIFQNSGWSQYLLVDARGKLHEISQLPVETSGLEKYPMLRLVTETTPGMIENVDQDFLVSRLKETVGHFGDKFKNSYDQEGEFWHTTFSSSFQMGQSHLLSARDGVLADLTFEGSNSGLPAGFFEATYRSMEIAEGWSRSHGENQSEAQQFFFQVIFTLGQHSVKDEDFKVRYQKKINEQQSKNHFTYFISLDVNQGTELESIAKDPGVGYLYLLDQQNLKEQTIAGSSKTERVRKALRDQMKVLNQTIHSFEVRDPGELDLITPLRVVDRTTLKLLCEDKGSVRLSHFDCSQPEIQFFQL